MADISTKNHDIPFVIDGVVKIVKSITKQTTCNDVLNKLPNLQCPLAVFESVNGVEKQLPGKTKLLKVWRAHGPSSDVTFVVKRSEHADLKRSRSSLFGRRQSTKSQGKRKLSGENLKRLTDLAFYVRYQKSKVQNMKRKFEEVDSEADDGARKLRNVTSTSSMDSMDAFLVKADLDKVAHFLNFCGAVTEEQLGARKAPKLSREQTVHAAESEARKETRTLKKTIIHASLKNMKLGFKQRFNTTSKGSKQTTSTGTISSADTGYQSEKSPEKQRKPAGLPKRHTFLETDQDGLPRHSTPRLGRSDQDHPRAATLPLSGLNETEGKDAILKKFFADQTAMATGTTSRATVGSFVTPQHKKDGFGLSRIPSQKDVCRFYWDVNCDSDSDSSSVAEEEDGGDAWNSSQLDRAFLDSLVEDVYTEEFITPRNRTLRRESAVTNLAARRTPADFYQDEFITPRNKSLRRGSAVSNLALCTMPINIENEDSDDSFDYSFDCTFPRLDETHCADVMTSAGGDSFLFNGDLKMAPLDDSSDVNLTNELLQDLCDSDDSFVESDEGLGSMSSGSVQEIMRI